MRTREPSEEMLAYFDIDLDTFNDFPAEKRKALLAKWSAYYEDHADEIEQQKEARKEVIFSKEEQEYWYN